MKVSKVTKAGKSSGSSKVKGKQESPKIKFTEILGQKDYDAQKKALEEALGEIDEKAKALAEERTISNLLEYKDLIRGFIEQVVNEGLEIVERRGFTKTGRTKIMRTVSEIDKKLVDLTDLIIKREKKEIGILEKVGQIQGLLIDLML